MMHNNINVKKIWGVRHEQKVKLFSWLTLTDWLSEAVCVCVCVGLCHLVPWYQQSDCRDWNPCFTLTRLYVSCHQLAEVHEHTASLSLKWPQWLCDCTYLPFSKHVSSSVTFKALITCPDSPFSHIAWLSPFCCCCFVSVMNWICFV